MYLNIRGFNHIIIKSTLISDYRSVKWFYEKQLQNFFFEKNSEFLINWLTIWFRFFSEKNLKFFDQINYSDFLLKKVQKRINNLHTNQICFVLLCSIINENTQQVFEMIKTSKINFAINFENYIADWIISNIKQTMKK